MPFSLGDRLPTSQAPLPSRPQRSRISQTITNSAYATAPSWPPLPQRCPPPRLPRIPSHLHQPPSTISGQPRLQRILLVGGWLVALFTLAMNLGISRSGKVNTRAPETVLCQTVIQPNATLSREQLAQVLTVPERSPQDHMREQLSQPYCQLPALEVRAGITAQREAYPLAFDPQTWLVLLFEDQEYAGYAFQFQS